MKFLQEVLSRANDTKSPLAHIKVNKKVKLEDIDATDLSDRLYNILSILEIFNTKQIKSKLANYSPELMFLKEINKERVSEEYILESYRKMITLLRDRNLDSILV